VGYHVNDTYSTYLDMGKPHQLSREQVNSIKKLNDGAPILMEIINIGVNSTFSRILDLNENDVYLLIW
jgi:xylan 1,4-beta-xylosidase